MATTSGETVATAQADPDASFRDVARSQLPQLLSKARRLVGDEAEDVVQDCLLKAFQRFDQLHDPAAAPAWLTRILVNCCRDRGRASARRPTEIDFDAVGEFSLYRKIAYEDPFPYSDSLHLDFLAEFGPEDVRAVLLRLPVLYRIPLVLVYMDGYLARELAEMIDVPVGTVLGRLHRGRKLFETQLWEYAEETGLLRGATMISCAEAVNQLWEYLDGTVAEADRARLEQHLSWCRQCCGELEFARELRRALAGSADVDLPADVLDRLSQTLEELDPEASPPTARPGESSGGRGSQ